jgi:hypothetical protein
MPCFFFAARRSEMFRMYFLQPIVFLSFLIVGCAQNEIYREKFEVRDMTCSKGDKQCEKYSLQIHNIGKDNPYSLGFVEIDDQGQLRDRRQMNALTKYLSNIAKEKSALVTVFVHGWHHNAEYEPEDGNLTEFKELLSGLSKIESKKTNKRKIIGIYVGWRGDSIAIPAIRYLTFWDRKSTAQEVGYLGMTELLLRLEKINAVRNSSNPTDKSRLVIIGHSFGGAVVYSATAQVLMSRFIESQFDCNTEREDAIDRADRLQDHNDGLGDLVVLLNPAFEALRYAPAFDMTQASCTNGTAPRLAILTSETDDATGKVFPLGRMFTTFFETHNDEVERKDSNYTSKPLDEGEADRNTIGHYMPFVSHRLEPLGKQKAKQIINNTDDLNKNIIWSKQVSKGTTQFGQTLLKHLGETNPTSPYLNIRVDRRIMDGHNGITGQDLKEFLTLLIHLTTDSAETGVKESYDSQNYK